MGLSRRQVLTGGGLLGTLWLLLLPTCQRLSWTAWLARRQTWAFPLEGAKRVTVRAWRVNEAKIIRTGAGGELRISAKPVLLPETFHGPEPVAHEETDAQKWTFGWTVNRQAEALELSSTGEVRYRSHRYKLEELEIVVPAGITVELSRKALEPR